MIPIGAYLKSDDPVARAAGLSELRPCVFVLDLRPVRIVCLESQTDTPLSEIEWIEYLP